jgi:hypothetical protein
MRNSKIEQEEPERPNTAEPETESSDLAQNAEPDPHAARPLAPGGDSWLRRNRDAVIIATVCLILGVAATIYFSLSSGSGSVIRNQTVSNQTINQPRQPQAPSAINSASDIAAYAKSRAFWGSSPAILTDSLGTAYNPPMDGNGDLLMPAQFGTIDAYGPADIISQDPGTIGSTPFYAVGRVENAIDSPVQGWTTLIDQMRDVQLGGPHGRPVVYALVDLGSTSPGDVIFFPAVIVASGGTKAGQATAYLVGLDKAKFVTDYGGLSTVPEVAHGFKGHLGGPSGGLPIFP